MLSQSMRRNDANRFGELKVILVFLAAALGQRIGLRRKPGELKPGLVEVRPLPTLIRKPNQARKAIGHTAKAQLTFPDGVLSLSSRGDILLHIAEHLPAVRPDTNRADRRHEPSSAGCEFEFVFESDGRFPLSALSILGHFQAKDLWRRAKLRLGPSGGGAGCGSEEATTCCVVVKMQDIVRDQLNYSHTYGRAVVESTQRRLALSQ
jgi:hypothetical protein